jgi:hypothetical protein
MNNSVSVDCLEDLEFRRVWINQQLLKFLLLSPANLCFCYNGWKMKVDSNKRKVSEEKDTPKMKKKVILMLNALWIDRHFGTSLWESLRKHHAKTLPHGNWTDRVLPYAM